MKKLFFFAIAVVSFGAASAQQWQQPQPYRPNYHLPAPQTTHPSRQLPTPGQNQPQSRSYNGGGWIQAADQVGGTKIRNYYEKQGGYCPPKPVFFPSNTVWNAATCAKPVY